MQLNLDKNQKAGIIGSAIATILVIVILMLFTLKPPYPPPPQLGVEVNLGNTDLGSGKIQPKIPKEVSTSQPQQSSSSNNTEKVVTQDTEESINLDDNSKDNSQSQQQEVVEEPEPVIDERFTFDKSDNNTAGEGTDNTPGDKGNENGDPNASNYVGDGNTGGVVSYSLSGRKAEALPEPNRDFNETGRVIVKIWVNRRGEVVNAKVQATGTTTTSSDLHKRALKAALKTKFNMKADAPEVQIGILSYNFVLRS